MCVKICFSVYITQLVAFVLIRSFNDFLQQTAHGKSDDYPKTFDGLARAGIRLVVTDSNDPDSVGFVQWRVAFYVAGEDGSVLNFLSSVWDKHREA